MLMNGTECVGRNEAKRALKLKSLKDVDHLIDENKLETMTKSRWLRDPWRLITVESLEAHMGEVYLPLLTKHNAEFLRQTALADEDRADVQKVSMNYCHDKNGKVTGLECKVTFRSDHTCASKTYKMDNTPDRKVTCKEKNNSA